MTAREYGEFLKKYQAKYGPATTVFMQVGSFYELYDFQNPETGKTLYNVSEIVDILGLQTSAKTEAQSGHTILTAGLPEYSLHRWAAKLTQMGWTVVIVEQNKDSSGRVQNRTVSRILSPGTHMETASTVEVPSILTILFRALSTSAPSYAVASLDLTTGQTKSYTASCQGTRDTWTADTLQQFTCIFPPKEVIIYEWCTQDETIITEEQFRRQFSVPYHIPVHVRTLTREQINTVKRELYREEQLRTIYSLRSLLAPQQLLGLRTDLEETSLILLAEYAEEHVSSALRKFQKNEAWFPSQNLICANNALLQLQIVPQQQAQGFATNSVAGLQTSVDSVLSLLSPAITPMGKRAIRERIVRPLSDAKKIQARHKALNIFNDNLEDSTRKQIELHLRFIYDLPRLHRKIMCGSVAKDDIPKLNQSYSAICVLIELLEEVSCLRAEFSSAEWKHYLSVFRTHFPIECSVPCSKECAELLEPEDSTPLHKDTYQNVGTTEKRIRETIQKIIDIRNKITAVVGVSQDGIRIEAREKEAFGLKTSTVILKGVDTKKQTCGLTQLSTAHLKSGGWIDCEELRKLNGEVVLLRAKLDRECREGMIHACNEMISGHFFESTDNIFADVETWIENLDCTRCLAMTALEMGWVRPEIVEDGTAAATSWLEIEGLRHPIVETARTRVGYVTHNIRLGGGGGANGTSKSNGWLIYGMNASGKSTLMKAVGIAVILAQAGSYVPARKMTLAPFRAIFTRILNHDNIFSGLSSFAVEMSELRDILRVADANSLVLGDELCAGTESDSAQALVAAGIEWLAKRQAKFLFATHLHDIPKLVDLPTLAVSVWHIHVNYDPITKRLVYDRQLREGSGSSLYGLEVARAMDLPYEFIESAVKNRQRLLGEFRRTESAKSAWSADLIKRVCELCGAPGGEVHLEVHHIRERATADSSRHFSTGEHMNHPRNLIVLCDKCHDKQHASASSSSLVSSSGSSVGINDESVEVSSGGNETITQIQQTSDGPMRIPMKSYESENGSKHECTGDEKQKTTHQKTKWSTEDVEIIQETICKFPKTGLKQLRFILKTQHNIDICESSLRKFKQTN